MSDSVRRGSVPDDPRHIAVPQDLAFEVLDVLRLVPIYSLMGSEFSDELPDDFKSHKWEGYEKEHAEKAVEAYRWLLDVMKGQVAPPGGHRE